MKFFSVCSGIEAASVAFELLGWKAVAFAEIEPFPSAVLAQRWPGVPNLGDITKYHEWPDLPEFDLLAGGPPCQGFSIAGLRGGMVDPRSQLTLTYVEIAAKYRPRWLVYENVPGLLSSADGADFAAFLGALTGREVRVPVDGWPNSGVLQGISAAYGVAWRVLDAQHFGVPQRRRRVFVVGYLGDWRRAAAVLFERHGLQGHSAPSREAGKGTAATVSASSPSRRNGGGDPTAGHFVAHPLRAQAQPSHRADSDTYVAHSLRGEGFDASEVVGALPSGGTPNGHGCSGVNNQAVAAGHVIAVPMAFSSKDHGADAGDISPTLRSMGHNGSHANGGGQVAVAFAWQGGGTQTTLGYDPDSDVSQTLGSNQTPAVAFQTRIARNGRGQPSEIVPALNGSDAGETSDMRPCVATGTAVRRLVPIECEALQGFPRDYTKIPWPGWRNMDPSETPEGCRALGLEVRQSNKGRWRVKDVDGPRYKALGNSWAVPVARWVGMRIAMVDALPH